jgi:putative transferase (TIGR04331 family)
MYLGTTRLDEFWPTERPLFLLGQWCLKENEILNKDYHSPHNILPYPWDNQDRFETAALYVQQVYERILAGLTNALNSIHGLNKPVLYWRIIIGPWLAWYLEAFYDRYMCIKDALEIDPHIVTIGLDSESYIVPNDFEDFVRLYLDDEYNLMLYTQIFEVLGLELKEKRQSHSIGDEVVPVRINKKVSKNLNSLILSILNSARKSIFIRSPIGMMSTGISLEMGVSLWLHSGFKISSCSNFSDNLSPVLGKNNLQRSHIRDYLAPSDEFESVVVSTLSQNIPISYVESFSQRRKKIVQYTYFPRAVVSAVGWYFDEQFKIYAAEAQNNGSKLLSLQHGGYYGMLKYMSPELHEQKISLKFYSWGWSPGLAENVDVIGMPSIHLLSLNKITKIRKNTLIKDSILFVTTKHPRYLYRFQSHPVGPQWKEYFMWELRFVQKLDIKTLKNLRIRLYPHSYGWGLKKFWAENMPNVSFANENKMVSLLASSSMMVIDHPSTTILESMALNIPTILYWDPSKFIMRSDVLPLLDELKNVGVLHESPESAASMINQIFNDPLSWWMQESVQKAKDKFCNRFAKISKNWIGEWKKELYSVAGLALE